MQEVIHLHDPSDGKPTIFYKNRGWRRVLSEPPDAVARWVSLQHTAEDPQKAADDELTRFFEHAYRHPETTEPVCRYSRRNAEDVASYRKSHRIAELEERADQWIKRGREANIELGRVFILLKELVGHGRFEKYYEQKFGRPYGIAFRTAQVYMQLARKEDEQAKCADPALFPPATDRQAVAIRGATEKARLAVADADQHSSDESITSVDACSGNDSEKPVSSMCTCRLYIRMTKDQRDSISALWKSEHKHVAEVEVTNYLMDLCAKYDVDGADSSEAQGRESQ